VMTITAADFAEDAPYFTFAIGACGHSLTQISFSEATRTRSPGNQCTTCDLRHSIWFGFGLISSNLCEKSSMSHPRAGATAHLQRIVERAMRETAQGKCDELTEEIWRVSEEREAIKEALTQYAQ
jgi:hypothetical protein